MREAAALLARPNATNEIIDHCITRLNGHSPAVTNDTKEASCSES
jgi:hypothetical protein